jgi:hypothetical protein
MRGRETPLQSGDELIAHVREIWTQHHRGLTKARDAATAARAACEQCVRDVAEGRITAEQERAWLRDHGEPRMAAASAALAATIRDVDAREISPLIDSWRRARVERMLALLMEVLAINGDVERMETAVRTLGLPARASCVVPELSAPWLAAIRDRLDRVLTSQRAVSRLWAPAPRPADPNYEPVIEA